MAKHSVDDKGRKHPKPHTILAIVLVCCLAYLFFLAFDAKAKLNSAVADYNSKIQALADSSKQQDDLIQSDVSTKFTGLQAELIELKNDTSKTASNLLKLIKEVEASSNTALTTLREDVSEQISEIEVTGGDFSGVISDALPAVVRVLTNVGQGSGAIIREDGYVVTNYHVLEGATAAKLTTYANKDYAISLVGKSEEYDVAVLKISSDESFPYLEFGDSDDVEVGEAVVALGNPAGLSFTATQGIVSAVHREGPNGHKVYIQTDVPINPGNSGGPLIDSAGNIIGLNNYKLEGFESLGFAIESNSVEDVVDALLQ